MVEKASELSSSIPLGLTQYLAEITDMLEVLASTAPASPDTPSYMGDFTPSREEVEEVIREAREEAKRRLEPEGLVG
ncbi:hypothetical protein D1872_298660 [compost metagenome]